MVTIAAHLMSKSAQLHALACEYMGTGKLEKGAQAVAGAGYLGASLVSSIECSIGTVVAATSALANVALMVKYDAKHLYRQRVERYTYLGLWYSHYSLAILKASLVALYKGVFPKTQYGAKLLLSYLHYTLRLLSGGKMAQQLISPVLSSLLGQAVDNLGKELQVLLSLTDRPSPQMRLICTALLQMQNLDANETALLRFGAGQGAWPGHLAAAAIPQIAAVLMNKGIQQNILQPFVPQLLAEIEGYLADHALLNKQLEGEADLVRWRKQKYAQVAAQGQRLGNWIQAKGLVSLGKWVEQQTALSAERVKKLEAAIAASLQSKEAFEPQRKSLELLQTQLKTEAFRTDVTSFITQCTQAFNFKNTLSGLFAKIHL